MFSELVPARGRFGLKGCRLGVLATAREHLGSDLARTGIYLIRT